jgi:hypothetical protein
MIQLLIFLLTTSDVSYIHDKNFDFSYNIFLILFDTPIMRLKHDFLPTGVNSRNDDVKKFCDTVGLVAYDEGRARSGLAAGVSPRPTLPF